MKQWMNKRYSERETRKVAEQLLALVAPRADRATVIGLSGDLGAGKTTLTQSIGKVLGVAHDIQSPTFVIARFYPTTSGPFAQLAHVDAYRIESLDELAPLGWDALLKQPNTLVVIEWPENIAPALPYDMYRFMLSHDDTHRTISYEEK